MSRSTAGRVTLFLLPALVAGAAVLFLLGSQPEAGGRTDSRKEGLPVPYASLVNPLASNAKAAQHGWRLFRDNCATCHGESANGRGPASQGLNPLPANLAESNLLDQHSDAYLFYRISEGKIGTAMPSFHGSLTPEERWQIVCYLRTLGRP